MKRRRRGLRVYLRRFNNRGTSRYYHKKNKVRKGLSIHKGPGIANERRRIGDWERDTMYTLKGIQVLVCTDQKSRFTKLCRLEKRDCESVDLETEKIIIKTGKRAFTMTNDNGQTLKQASP